jgi:hypothetical protein
MLISIEEEIFTHNFVCSSPIKDIETLAPQKDLFVKYGIPLDVPFSCTWTEGTFMERDAKGGYTNPYKRERLESIEIFGDTWSPEFLKNRMISYDLALEGVTPDKLMELLTEDPYVTRFKLLPHAIRSRKVSPIAQGHPNGNLWKHMVFMCCTGASPYLS